MPFIPNEADAAFPDQAEPDAGDFDILANGGGSIGVVSGCAVTAQATPDMTVAVASGRVVAGALPGVAVTAGNLTIAAADATNPRFDLISVNSSGVKAVIAGTASTNPVFPLIPASTVILAAIYIPAGDTAINANQIRDKRVFVLEPAKLSDTPPPGDGTGTAGVETTGARGDHAHPATVTANVQEASYTLVLSDLGKVIEMNVAGANTLTVPPDSSVAFPVGSLIEVHQYGAGQVTITAGAGVALRNNGSKFKTAGQYASASLRKRATDEWVVSGDLVT